jgi:hypothetical protein
VILRVAVSMAALRAASRSSLAVVPASRSAFGIVSLFMSLLSLRHLGRRLE